MKRVYTRLCADVYPPNAVCDRASEEGRTIALSGGAQIKAAGTQIG
jgi:hypothetical protein